MPFPGKLRLGQRAQFVVPISFEGIGHQPIVRIDAEVTALCEFGLVSCSRDVCLTRSVCFVETGLQFLLDGEGYFHCHWTHGLNQDVANGPVDRRSGYALANGHSMPDAGPLADIFGPEKSPPGMVTDSHSIPADAARCYSPFSS